MRPLAVAELLDQLRVESGGAPVRLRGKALGLIALPEEAPQFMSGLLSDPDSRAVIRFQCGLDNAVAYEGEYVEIEGDIEVLPARLHSGLEVVVRGRKVADFQPNAPDSPGSFSPEPARAPTPLTAPVYGAEPSPWRS